MITFGFEFGSCCFGEGIGESVGDEDGDFALLPVGEVAVVGADRVGGIEEAHSGRAWTMDRVGMVGGGESD